MHQIQLLFVENIIRRDTEGARQELTFLVSVCHPAYEKRVTVRWCGEDGLWHSLAAEYQVSAPDNREGWRAHAVFPLTRKNPLPGNILFAVSLECGGETFWENNGGKNYQSDADSGVIVYGDAPMRHVNYSPHLHTRKVTLPVEVAVRSSLVPQTMVIHWSADAWQTSHKVACRRHRNHWDLVAGSNARNPNRYGWEIWVGRIPVKHAYQVEYAVECQTAHGVVWDNFRGRNYRARRETLRVMTLNLHTYQEEDQMEKFETIARAISELRVDVACLQEVGENWNGGAGDWASNAARIINEHLPNPYFLHTDWAHQGFDRYREGVAILSRHPFANTDSGYVSDNQDPFDIHSRKVVVAQIQVPYVGPVNVFSAHLSWPEDGFTDQFDRLDVWARERHHEQVVATLLGGDFNIEAGSDAYKHVVDTGEWEDQFLKVKSRHAFDRVFRDRRDDLSRYFGHDRRIDYLWMRKGSRLRAIAARELFTEQDYGRVSDHTAYLVEFELI